MDLWPLLTDDLLTGVYSIERQLRPRMTAVAVRRGSVDDFREVVNTLCTRWGGGFLLLPSVDPEVAELDSRVVKMLLGSNIDGLESRGLFSEEIERRYSDQWADAVQWLLRQVAYLKDPPQVQTCRGVPKDSPWYPAYLALFGDVPDEPNRDRNRWNDLREDLAFGDVVAIRSVDGEPSIPDQMSRLLDLQRISSVELTRVRLPTSVIGGYNKGMPSTSRFGWGQSSVLTRYGPNLLVVYQPDGVEDLALLWNLRARFAHPAGLPLAVPLTDAARQDIVSIAHRTPMRSTTSG